jgi:phosphoserine phosphatase
LKLLVLDIEGTLFETEVHLPGTSITSTIWQAIAQALGADAVAAEVETHRRWERQEYKSYLDWMKDTIDIHKRCGLSASLFHQLVTNAKYNPGVVEILPRIDRTRYEPVLVSGGFRELAARAQRDLDIQHAFAACEYLFGEDGRLEAYNLLPCDFQGKIDFINLMLREYGLSSSDWVFVGDGANDVPIAEQAPLSIGYRPHPALKRVATHAIVDFAELVPILESHDGGQALCSRSTGNSTSSSSPH